MSARPLLFADATATFDEAQYVIFGVPFDKTCTFRKGTREAPKTIRKASYNFETYMMDHDADILEARICDLGDLQKLGTSETMLRKVEATARRIVANKKFSIAIGGEHSIAPPCVKAHESVGVVIIDAHLDFRDSYRDDRNSHACSTKRLSEIVGVDNVLPIGIRSFSGEEKEDAKRLGLRFVTSYDILQGGIGKALGTLEEVPWSKVYLTLDMDGIDPAYAPGVGNPEPFGLTPLHVKWIIGALADRLVGFDLVEVSPPYDNGNTSALAARLIREVVMATVKGREKST